MRQVTLRGLLAHKMRLALTALAIVLGVTFISGTFVLTDTLNSTFSTLFTSVYSKIDFQVRGVPQFGSGSSATRNPLPESLLSRVRAVPGVAAAAGNVQGADNLAGQTLAAFMLPTAQRVVGETGQFDFISVIAKPGPDKAAVQRSIAQVLPPDAQVVTGQTIINEGENAVSQALSSLNTSARRAGPLTRCGPSRSTDAGSVRRSLAWRNGGRP
jgi:hypothetical protein